VFGKAQLAQGVYGSPLAPDRKLAQIALEDIAQAVPVLPGAHGRHPRHERRHGDHVRMV
jgi:hypothetical protein